MEGYNGKPKRFKGPFHMRISYRSCAVLLFYHVYFIITVFRAIQVHVNVSEHACVINVSFQLWFSTSMIVLVKISALLRACVNALL